MTLSELLRVGPGPVDLSSIDPAGTPGLPDAKAVRKHPKIWAREELVRIGERLAGYQEMMFASGKAADSKRRVLLVLQAMDCGGKDGTVKHVAGHLNPLGLHIRAFGKPTPEELGHHFLWRIRRALPAAGYFGIFNRSHYEDVLVARVHSLVPEEVWQGRYDEINAFERQLVEDGVTLVKVMLHISYDEQAARLADRLADPTKFWKYNPGDIDERARWADYQAAYADALTRCAGWYVVPANRKWYRDWAISTLLLERMGQLDLSYPPAGFDPQAEQQRLKATVQIDVKPR
jgi:PPK2 family polyphosphate:nucleotide phosphotransferase